MLNLASTAKNLVNNGFIKRIRPVVIYIVAGSVFFLIYMLMDQFVFGLQSAELNNDLTTNAWYLPTGLILAFLVAFGASYIPVVILSIILSQYIIWHLAVGLDWVIIYSLGVGVGYGLLGLVLRRIEQRNNSDGVLKTVSFLLAVLVGPAVINLANAIFPWISGEFSFNQLFTAWLNYYIGDVVGILALTPFLLAQVVPHIPSVFFNGKKPGVLTIQGAEGIQAFTRKRLIEILIQTTGILFTVWLALESPLAQQSNLLYLTFIPLIWIALRNGFNGVTSGLALFNITVPLALVIVPQVYVRMGDLQIYAIVLALSCMLLGASVSERRQVESSLRENEEFFRLGFRAIPDPAILWEMNPDGRIVFESYDRAFLEYSNGIIQKYQGSFLEDIYSDFPGVMGAIREVFRNGKQQREEISLTMFPTGTPRWAIIDYVPMAERYVLMIIKDITEHKHIEETLRASEQKFRSMIEQSSDGITVIDSQGNLLEWNQSMERMTGIPRLEAVGRKLVEITMEMVTPDQRNRTTRRMVTKRMHNLIRSGDLLDGDSIVNYKITHRDGSLRYLSQSTFVVHFEGDFLGCGVVRDDTDRYQAEESKRISFERAEALRQVTAAVVSDLNLEQVLEKILFSLEQVIPYDSASVMLIKNGYVRVMAGRGLPEQSEAIGQEYPANNSLLTEIRRTNSALILADAQADARFLNWNNTSYVRGWIGVPMRVHGRLIGYITIDSRTPNAYNPEQLNEAQTFADEVSIAIENAQLYEQAQRLAITDPLTGIYNRRYFFTMAEREFKLAKRYKHPMSLVMIDLDHFKLVNDNYGHDVGDRVLVELLHQASLEIRSTDILARYGGEEFIALLPETTQEKAFQIADRLRERVADIKIPVNEGEIQVTASIGVAGVSEDCKSLDEAIRRVDFAMYNAKAEGRNRVSIWKNEPPVRHNGL
jgi:diguanylate cyclase (GGDEF)-like protein/PAS domain S-box-containing protein